MKMILYFEEIGKEDIKLAGGKGANLGEMKKNHFQSQMVFVLPARLLNNI